MFFSAGLLWPYILCGRSFLYWRYMCIKEAPYKTNSHTVQHLLWWLLVAYVNTEHTNIKVKHVIYSHVITGCTENLLYVGL